MYGHEMASDFELAAEDLTHTAKRLGILNKPEVQEVLEGLNRLHNLALEVGGMSAFGVALRAPIEDEDDTEEGTTHGGVTP